ncbi:MAG TPA: BREX-1 system adenine-specific DNA-methyltransferase PglX [Pirellulales bacterium]|nr:BREX-1 system adenine-specific DNA-methyltransferase PglX [Pirellulales bacterium]
MAYRHFLDWLGGLLSEEIGVLFNPNDSANRLYPTQKVLDEVLGLLNDEALAEIWTQDETIGWVYQYFTPKELRDQARKESAAPRNSYELAFRNQFFTPRYVVEFLTDNTLGRTWYEMRKGDTRLKDQCRYMVRRPTEVFLAEGESERVASGGRKPPVEQPKHHDTVAVEASGGRQPPVDVAVDVATADAADASPLVPVPDDLSQEELLKQPVYIPHRPKKDPRDIKILDPACGSGHFLLYCFDLLLTIYEEAYDDPDLGPALKTDYTTIDDLRKAVPGLILKHNLHGIDIDLRASQIAALALWLRCQRAYHDMGLKTARPRITRSNLVCAEPMPGEEHMLKEFVGQLEPKLLGQLVEVVFDKMKLAGEAGSLLKIEEELRDAIGEARKQWAAETEKATDRKGRTLLFSQAEMDRVAKSPQQSLPFDVSGITDDQFFEQAEAKVVEALRNYAERDQNGQRLQRRLFTEDAVRGFAFVDICHKRFDVVLMNPPFGLPTDKTFKYLECVSLPTYVEMYASFVERALSGLVVGFVGAITSRSFTTMSRLAEWRRTSVVDHLDILLDLGLGVMDDAAVESCAYVLSIKALVNPVLVLDLRLHNNKHGRCLAQHWCPENENAGNLLFIVNRHRFQSTNQSKLLYRLKSDLHAMLDSSERFETAGGIVRTGLTTFDDFRFLRLRWEVTPKLIGEHIYWEPFSKGGEGFKFHSDVHLLVNRRNEGAELGEANIRCNGQVAQSRQGSSYYYKPGLTFTSRCSSFSVRALPEGCVISHNAPSIYGHTNKDTLYLLGWVNSRLMRALVEIQANKEYYVPGSVKTLPWKEPGGDGSAIIQGLAIRLYDLNKNLTASDETTAHFVGREWSFTLLATFEHEMEYIAGALQEIRQLQHSVSEAVDEIYGVDSAGFSAEIVGYDPDEDVLAETPTLNSVASEAVSFCVGCVVGRWNVVDSDDTGRLSPLHRLPVCSQRMLKALRFDRPAAKDELPDGYPLAITWEGILVDDRDNADDIVRRVRDVLEVVWKDRAEAIEKEACEILDVAELRAYFRKAGKGGFWDDHMKRYSKSRRKAPIYWLLQSKAKNYALWLYYHRLDKDLLFKALANYVEPKVQRETNRLVELRQQKQAGGLTGKAAKKLDKEIERQEDLISELRDFEDKLRRTANLHLEPDLNDGVVLNIAPLWELVPWKEAKKYWEELMEGKYEWSTIGKQLREKGLVK